MAAAAQLSRRITVTLQYFDGCPNWQTLRERLAAAVTVAGADHFQIQLMHVDTPEDAERLHFRGSPTVLVDGLDLFVNGPTQFGLSCRVYDGPGGAPSVEQISAALTAARVRAQTLTDGA